MVKYFLRFFIFCFLPFQYEILKHHDSLEKLRKDQKMGKSIWPLKYSKREKKSDYIKNW